MGPGGGGDSQSPYRQQVISALVHRYIESARREFEESKRKGKVAIMALIYLQLPAGAVYENAEITVSK